MEINEYHSLLNTRTRKISSDEYYQQETMSGDMANLLLEKAFLPLIGQAIVSFNALESRVDWLLSDLLCEEHDDRGWIIIKDLFYQQKAKLLIDLMNNNPDRFTDLNHSEIKILKDELTLASDIRNRIVHGDWEEMTKTFMVKSKMKNSDAGFRFIMTTFKVEELTTDVEFIDDLSHKLWTSPKFKLKQSI